MRPLDSKPTGIPVAAQASQALDLAASSNFNRSIARHRRKVRYAILCRSPKACLHDARLLALQPIADLRVLVLQLRHLRAELLVCAGTPHMLCEQQEALRMSLLET